MTMNFLKRETDAKIINSNREAISKIINLINDATENGQSSVIYSYGKEVPMAIIDYLRNSKFGVKYRTESVVGDFNSLTMTLYLDEVVDKNAIVISW